MNFPVEAWVSTGTGQSDCVWVSKLSGRLAPHAQTLTSCVWEFKSVLWWCVTGCIYVWPPAVPSYQNASPVWIITVYRHTEAELTPPLRQAPLCWHLKNQTALSSETWDLQAEERQPFGGEIKKYTEEEEICGKRKKNKRERKKKWRKFYMEHYKEREMSFKAATSFNSFFFPLRSGWSSWEWFQPSFGSNQLSGKICFQYEVPAFTGNGSPLHWATARLCVVPSPAAPEPKGTFQKWLLKTGPVQRGRWVMEN